MPGTLRIGGEAQVGLAGVGSWGRNHLRVLSGLGALRLACDPDPAALERVPPSHRARDLDELLADPRVRAVVLATPARTHYALARRVLESGRDVFVEKPLTLDPAEGDHLVELARERARVLMVGHITLHHPAIVRLRQLVAEGVLGRLLYLYANRLNLGTVRETEDTLWSFAPHDIAVFLSLLGHPPARVSASGGAYLRAGRADVTVTHLEFGDVVKGHIFVSWLHPMKEHRLVVIGDRRMAVFRDGAGGGELLLFAPGAAGVEDARAAPRPEPETVAFERLEPLRAELVHFLECIATRAEPVTGGRHGAEVIRVLDAARRSLEQDGVPVQCGFPPFP
jgi:UDP-2-acetamido-3-amino-2,3-dideoxy-glucuronate N-acetyltransferase